MDEWTEALVEVYKVLENAKKCGVKREEVLKYVEDVYS